MAAVAGSKGKINTDCARKGGVQVSVVADLMNGNASPAEAAERLLQNASLREIGIDTNMICNLNCQYCYLGDRKEEKGSADFVQLADKLKSLAATETKLFAFIGKEPLSDDRATRLIEALGYLRNKQRMNFRTGMVTNGTLVDRWIDRLVDAQLSYLDISIDGISDLQNKLRGDAVTDRIMAGINTVVNSPLRENFATATVLTEASIRDYPEFVSRMFDKGVVTCFSSPVLRFAMSNQVADIAISLDEILKLCEALSNSNALTKDRQVIIDLPYRYSWAMLNSGNIPLEQLREDSYEALHWNPQQGIYLKLNPFPFSYWRALRVTHDGHAILNMDLAAHIAYSTGTIEYTDIDSDVFTKNFETGISIMSAFIKQHIETSSHDAKLFERNLNGQYLDFQKLVAIAA